MKFDGEFLYGEKNKKGKKYNEKGELMLEGFFYNNKICNGKGKSEYKIGKIYEGEFKNGEKIGKCEEFYKDGNLKFEGEYLNNRRYKGKCYNKNGQLTFEGEYRQGDFKAKKFKGKRTKYSNNKLFLEGELLFFKKHGKCKEYGYSEGNLIFEGEYFYGKKHGIGKTYYNGKIEFMGEYVFDWIWKGKQFKYDHDTKELKSEYEILYGKKNGKGIKYFKGGKKRFEGEYLNGKKWNGKGFAPNGELFYEIKNFKGSIFEKYDFYGNLVNKAENI